MNEVIIDFSAVIDPYGYAKDYLRYQIDKCKDKPVRLKVKSMGGDVFEAIAISAILKEHGSVTAEVIGAIASAATFMLDGAKKIEMHEDAFYLVHKCMAAVDIYGQMNSDEIDATIKTLQSQKKSQDAIDLTIANKYLYKASTKGKTMADVLALMKEERWMNAEEAASWGFIDEVLPMTKNTAVKDFAPMLVSACAAMKYPSPEVVEKVETREQGIVEAILNKIKTAFAPQDENVINQNINQKPKSKMNKNFVAVASLLAVDGFEETDGTITMSAAQMQAINDALAKNTELEKTLKEAETALDSVSANVKAIKGITNKVNAIKAVVDFIPAGIPAAQGTKDAEGEKKDNFDDVKVDPVNDFFQGED